MWGAEQYQHRVDKQHIYGGCSKINNFPLTDIVNFIALFFMVWKCAVLLYILTMQSCNRGKYHKKFRLEILGLENADILHIIPRQGRQLIFDCPIEINHNN